MNTEKMREIRISQEEIREHKGKPYNSIFGEIPHDFQFTYVKLPDFLSRENDIESLRKPIPSFSGETVTSFPARPMAFEEVVWKILREKYGRTNQKIISYTLNPNTDEYIVQMYA